MTDVKAAVTEDVVYRIEVSLSSRKSSVVVIRTLAKLYSLHNSGGDAEWKQLAYGVPCILLQRETTEHNSPFAVKVVVAELETGNLQWEGEVNHDSQYQAMQANFHAFAVNRQTYALQFVSPPEASRMLVSVRDFIRQKEETDIINFNQSNQGKKKTAKPKRKPSKKNISTPSNFKHVTNVSNQQCSTAGDFGGGGGFTRHLSFSAGDRSRPVPSPLTSEAPGEKPPQALPSSPGGGNPLYAEIGEHLLEDKGTQPKTDDTTTAPVHSNATPPLQSHAFQNNAGPPPSLPNHHPALAHHPNPQMMRGSVRLPRKQEEGGDNEIDEPLIERGSLRHSLPTNSHHKQRVRPPLASMANFEGPAFRTSYPVQARPDLAQDPGMARMPPANGAAHHPPEHRLDQQGPMLSSQPNLVASREVGGAPPLQQPTQAALAAHQPHPQKPHADAGYRENGDFSRNSLPRQSGNSQFGSTVPSNLRTLSVGPMSASMPSMERGGGLSGPTLAPLFEHHSGPYPAAAGGGGGGAAVPATPSLVPGTAFNYSSHLRGTITTTTAAAAANSPAGGSAFAPPFPFPPFVSPPPFSHPHRTVPFAPPSSTTPPTPSTPPTPVPPLAAGVSLNALKVALPSTTGALAASPLYDVLPPLQQPPPQTPAVTDSPPRQDVRARPQSYHPWTSASSRTRILEQDSIRSADLHATDV